MPRTKPSVRIHLSIAHHAKTSDAWADLEKRAVIVEILRLAGERFAGKTGNRVSMRLPDRMAAACIEDPTEADRRVEEACRAVGWRLDKRPNRWDVTIRNFSKKQGFHTEESDTIPVRETPEKSASDSDSDSDSNSDSDSKSEKRESAPAARRSGGRRKAKPGGADPRVVDAWPRVRAAFASHGRELGEAPGADRSALLAKRLDEGATPDDLVAAVHGYVASHGGLEAHDDGFDPGRYFQPRTVFKAEGFSDRVDAGRNPNAGRTPSVLHAFPNVRTGR